jgi:hypothetical protein
LLRTVDELIDPNTGQWEEELISSIFNPLVAQRIMQIPLSSNVDEDFVAWHKTKSFTFSVRSAYYSEWEHQYRSRIRRTDGQGPSRTNEVWEKPPSSQYKLNVDAAHFQTGLGAGGYHSQLPWRSDRRRFLAFVPNARRDYC